MLELNVQGEKKPRRQQRHVACGVWGMERVRAAVTWRVGGGQMAAETRVHEAKSKPPLLDTLRSLSSILRVMRTQDR